MSEIKTMPEEEKLLRNIFGVPEGFSEDLCGLINKYNLESKANVPDFILARFMCESLRIAENMTLERDKWWGKELFKPGEETTQHPEVKT